MHHAIDFRSQLDQFLVCTPRKKSLKHQLIKVTQGLVLVKLGKLEYALEAGQWFWLPFDTLVSLTYTPNTQTQNVFVSSRVLARFPRQAGFVEANELLTALINRLETITEHRDQQISLLNVVQQELVSLKPKLTESPLTQQFNQWRADKPSSLSSELKLVLRMREANKQMQSGQKRTAVVESLFNSDETLFSNLERTLLGR